MAAKAEATTKGENPRFIVISFSIEEYAAKALYEEFSCARGEMDNRINECQLDMFADRLSVNLFRVNQLRLGFDFLAYVLVETLRRHGLGTTQFARATPTIVSARSGLQRLQTSALTRPLGSVDNGTPLCDRLSIISQAQDLVARIRGAGRYIPVACSAP